MNNNELDIAVSISRAQRIQIRAESYINGEIDLDTFYMLEQIDNSATASQPFEFDAKTITLDESQNELAEEFSNKPFPKTKKELLKRPLHEINALYQAHPDKVNALLNPKPKTNSTFNLSREEFFKLPLYEQADLYEKYPAEVGVFYDK